MSEPSTSQSRTQILLETTAFAAHKHAQQRRKDPARTPYINHPVDVARRISSPPSSIAGDEVPIWILQAALLHDTVEDTDTSLDEIAQLFGKRVASIVDECSDDPSLNKAGRKQAQIDSAPHKSTDAKHVKLADKLSNLSGMIVPDGVPVGWTVERVQEYFVWGKRVSDGCADANPGLAQELDKLYKEATFTFKGKKYKAHPTYS